jgi:hypothetical protein
MPWQIKTIDDKAVDALATAQLEGTVADDKTGAGHTDAKNPDVKAVDAQATAVLNS